MSRYQGPSESQSNAEALARRGSPYTAASDASFRVKWDVNRREPDNLRDAVRMVRKAYSDEVPDKLHDGPDAIGDDGTPRMTARAVGYIFGDPEGDDAGKTRCTCGGIQRAMVFQSRTVVHERDCPGLAANQPLTSWYHSPFRANLSTMARGTDTQRLYAAIVQSITIGGQDPRLAAMASGVRPEAIAKGVALMALRAFLRSMTDLKLHVPREDAVA